MTDKETRSKRFHRLFVTGIILIVVASVVWLIPSIYIGNIDGKLNSLALKDGLTLAEIELTNNLRWNKVWWETAQVTMFTPTSTILLVIGMVLIAYGLVTRFA